MWRRMADGAEGVTVAGGEGHAGDGATERGKVPGGGGCDGAGGEEPGGDGRGWWGVSVEGAGDGAGPGDQCVVAQAAEHA